VHNNEVTAIVNVGRAGRIAPSAIRFVSILALALAATGCAEFKVTHGDRKREVGLQYYLPKPYLMITKNVTFAPPVAASAAESGSADKSTSGDAVTEVLQYSAHILYLPDLVDGERTIWMKPWLGSVSSNLALANGWQLTGANVTLDSKTAESVTGAGAVAGGLAPMFTPVAGGSGFATELVKALAPTLEKLAPQAAGDFVKAAIQESKAEIWLYEIRLSVDGERVEFDIVDGWKPWKPEGQ